MRVGVEGVAARGPVLQDVPRRPENVWLPARPYWRGNVIQV